MPRAAGLAKLDVHRERSASHPPRYARDRIQMPRSPMVVRTVPALRRALDGLRAEKPRSRWCQPWVLSMTVMCRWCGWPNAARQGDRLDLRQPDPVRADGRFRLLPAHLEGRRRHACRRECRPDLEPGCQDDVPGGFCDPDRAGGPGHRRSRGSLPAALLRRRCNRGRQTVHAMSGRILRSSARRIFSNCGWSPRWPAISTSASR